LDGFPWMPFIQENLRLRGVCHLWGPLLSLQDTEDSSVLPVLLGRGSTHPLQTGKEGRRHQLKPP
jgi:hypothetical protein